MTIDPNIKLADLVTERPWAAPILERHRLDYCCGGHRRLKDAARTARCNVESVIEEIESTPSPVNAPETDVSGMSMTSLIDHLEATHHEYLRDALVRLDQLAEKVRDVHSANHPELSRVRELVRALRAELEPHLAKEEQILFPMIRELEVSASLPTFHCGSLGNPISVMMSEHESTGELLEQVRTFNGEFQVPSDACASYRALYEGLSDLEADTHMHIHKENNLLFPSVVRAEQALASR